jgi:uncharacterized protein YukE
VTGLMGLTPLESLVARMLEVRSSWLQVGGPDRIAGDPAGMRNLAGRHRAVAARLSAARMDGRDQARALLGGPWRGEASERFERYWGGLEGRLAELAAAHEELAGLLEESAATAEGLNSEARALWSSAESWLSEAEQAVSRLDAGAVPRLLTEGMALVPRFDRLLRQAAVLAGETGRRLMTPRLDFSRRPPGPRPPLTRHQGPIRIPDVGGSVMSYRDRAPQWRRPPPQIPLPVPPPPGAGRRPPGNRPPAGTTGGRPVRRPPDSGSGPSPPIWSGTGTPTGEGRLRPGRTRTPRPGSSPVEFPGQVVGHPAPPPVHERVAPYVGHVDAYILQTITLGVLLGQKAVRFFRGRGKRTAGSERGDRTVQRGGRGRTR